MAKEQNEQTKVLQKPKPTVHIDQKTKGKVGETIEATLKLKKVSESISRYDNKKPVHSSQFEVEDFSSVTENDDDKYEDGGRPNVQRMIEDGLNEKQK